MLDKIMDVAMLITVICLTMVTLFLTGILIYTFITGVLL